MAKVNPSAASLRLSPRLALTYAAVTSAMFSAGATVPTPIFRLYQENLGLSPAMVTLVFATYAFSLLAALLTVGSLSDHLGRKPVALAALLANLGTMTAFYHADSAASLIGARAMQGFANGAAITTLAAAVLDLNPVRGQMVNGVTPFAGLAAGAGLAGVLASFAPMPTQLVYLVMIGLTLLLILPLALMPETVSRKPGAWASLKPQVRIPEAARGPLFRITPINIAGWGVNGLYFSLMPAVVRSATGIGSPLVGGLVVATIALASTAAVVGLRAWDAARLLNTFVALLVPGIGLTLFGVQIGALGLMFVGTVFSGVAIGAGFLGILRTILPRAEAHERAGLLSAYFLQSYLALSVPAMLVGAAVPYVGLTNAATIYGGVAIVLALASFAALRSAPVPSAKICPEGNLE